MILARYVEKEAALFFSTSRVRGLRVFKAYRSTSIVPQLPNVRRRREYNAWSDEEIDTLIKARKSDMGSKEIHSLYFPYRTLESVEQKATVVYPSGRVGWSEEDASTLIACRRRGDSFKEIQAKHFPNRTTWACKMKYTYATKVVPSIPASRRRPRQPWSDHDDEHVMSLRDQGKTVAETRELAYPKCSLITLQRRLTRLHANRHPGIVRLKTSKLWSVEE